MELPCAPNAAAEALAAAAVPLGLSFFFLPAPPPRVQVCLEAVLESELGSVLRGSVQEVQRHLCVSVCGVLAVVQQQRQGKGQQQRQGQGQGQQQPW